VGVIGVGFLGERHAHIYHRMDNVQFIGVFDIKPRRAKSIARKYKTECFPSLESLLTQVDAVSVVTPTIDHCHVTKKCLARACHVMVEKPMTNTVKEAEELLRLAEANQRILQVGHVERFNAAVIAVSDIINTPRFIEVHRLGPYSFRSTDIDVVLDLMIHDIDIVLCLVKSPVKEISAYGTPVLSSKNDVVNAKLVFANKCVVNLTASRLTLKSTRKFRVFDNEKYISLDYMKQEAIVYTKRSTNIKKPRTLLDLISRRKLRVRKNKPLVVELASFVDAVRYGRDPLVSGSEARDALAIAEEIVCQTQKYLS